MQHDWVSLRFIIQILFLWYSVMDHLNHSSFWSQVRDEVFQVLCLYLSQGSQVPRSGSWVPDIISILGVGSRVLPLGSRVSGLTFLIYRFSLWVFLREYLSLFDTVNSKILVDLLGPIVFSGDTASEFIPYLLDRNFLQSRNWFKFALKIYHVEYSRDRF